ncbi:hypothetical protein VMCG_10422 [Cytospora schulzeri]|uniref:Uncharacterized protein n=1 Tax=Cytospora schulzeri TaxID=448051 RepID=A0A423VBD5_9PEZI|nr:hypothetical protein VMCG_10422 [Valsa malicola]
MSLDVFKGDLLAVNLPTRVSKPRPVSGPELPLPDKMPELVLETFPSEILLAIEENLAPDWRPISSLSAPTPKLNLPALRARQGDRVSTAYEASDWPRSASPRSRDHPSFALSPSPAPRFLLASIEL